MTWLVLLVAQTIWTAPAPGLRTDVPWFVAAHATTVAVRCTSVALPAGARCAFEAVGTGGLLTVQSVPEQRESVLRALATLPGATFVDGVPALSSAHRSAIASAAAHDGIVLPLLPSAALFDLEGAVLRQLVGQACDGAVDIVTHDAGLALQLHTALPMDQLRDRLQKLRDVPPSAASANVVVGRATAALLFARATVGDEARSRALAWLLTPTDARAWQSTSNASGGEDARTLIARVRSRLVLQALVDKRERSAAHLQTVGEEQTPSGATIGDKSLLFRSRRMPVARAAP